jgi:hypothetical protein
MANDIQRKCRIGKREIRAGRNSDKSKDYAFLEFTTYLSNLNM